MTLKLINLGPKWTRIVLVTAAILSLLMAWYFIRWNLGNVMASRVDPTRPEAPLLADWLTSFAPDDPASHLLAGMVYERTFEPNDLERAVREYETAAALSPNNYLMWMHLGKIRGLAGDSEGAFAAYRRSLELAPNYAAIHWALGNALLRDGQTEAGFEFIAKAAAGNADYLRPGIFTALQIFDGNAAEVRSAMGDTPQVNAGLASALASADRDEEAFESWKRLPAESRLSDHKALGESLASRLIERHQYRMAVRMIADITDGEKPDVGNVTNAGFETPVKPKDARAFEWKISEGTHPQIGLSDALKRSGQYSLLLLFSSFEAAGLRSVEQIVALEPNVDYELEFYYRSDIRSAASLRWEIDDPVTSTKIAVSDPLQGAADWTPVRIRFRSPAVSDAVRLRLIREGCTGPSCPMNGRISFDDFLLRRS